MPRNDRFLPEETDAERKRKTTKKDTGRHLFLGRAKVGRCVYNFAMRRKLLGLGLSLGLLLRRQVLEDLTLLLPSSHFPRHRHPASHMRRQ